MRRVTFLALACLVIAPVGAQQPPVSAKPDTPFKLATFETVGKTRLGLVLGTRILDIDGANAELTRKASLPVVRIPGEMRALIEAYGRVSPRLYQIANYFKDVQLGGAAFAFDAGKVSITVMGADVVRLPVLRIWML